jgi:hypothetical protein
MEDRILIIGGGGIGKATIEIAKLAAETRSTAVVINEALEPEPITIHNYRIDDIIHRPKTGQEKRREKRKNKKVKRKNKKL